MEFWCSTCLLMFLLIFSACLKQPHSSILCHDDEKRALLQFKQSFDIDCSTSIRALSSYPKVRSWHQEVVDHKNATNSSVSVDCCKWDGVDCDKETGHVIGLNLIQSCLYGTFSPNSTLFDLVHLERLHLDYNNFNLSQIPSAIGRLYRLTGLDLFGSFFSGHIPLEIAHLSRLNTLDLSNNGDSSGANPNINLKLGDLSLEKLVRNLTRLIGLALDSVLISSTTLILSNLTSLKYLYLQDCNLHGEFPTSVFMLPNIEEVFLNYNGYLGGALPHEFQSGSRLTDISLVSTAFSGSLPPSIGNLASLSTLDLFQSGFSGTLPLSLGNLTKLTYLDLGVNSFNGDLPSSIRNLTQLTTLGLSYLSISPIDLDSLLLQLNKLEQLSLNNMYLGGHIPHSLVNLTGLQSLDLSYTQLTGSLPHWFANLTKLTFLTLDGNQLQGPIPEWLPQLDNLQSLALSFNNSIGNFDVFLKLPNLVDLSLSGISLTFPPDLSFSSSSHPKLSTLDIESCSLTEFPQFLRYQDELQDLALCGNYIAGDIPQWLVNITRNSLLSLNLSDNLLTGIESIPTFNTWNILEVLDISGNKMQGQLPAPPIFLQIYQVSNNRFSGVMPSEICNASSLIYLDVSKNDITGRVPDCISHQLGSSLQVLNLRDNNLLGTIPDKFTGSCKLRMINLSQNNLKGKLPKSLANCAMLEVLDIGRNRISDTFPSWLGSLPELQVLVLRHNNFHGQVAEQEDGRGCFQRLRIIDLSYNFYEGTLPYRYLQNWPAMRITSENQMNSSNSVFILNILDSSVTRYERYDYGITITVKGSETFYSKVLTVFRVLDFSSNKFSGEIPDIVGSLRGLQALNLLNNYLSGRIPTSVANMIEIESLDISRNRLTGDIPKEFSQLTTLEVFNVSHNYLVGSIPSGEQFSTFDNSSFDGNLGLCGAPLSKQCTNQGSRRPPAPPVSNVDETENNSMLIDWIVRSLGCVSGCIVGFIIGKFFITDKYHDWFMETFDLKQRNNNKKKKNKSRRTQQNRMR